MAVGMGKGEGESKARGAELLTQVTKVISILYLNCYLTKSKFILKSSKMRYDEE